VDLAFWGVVIIGGLLVSVLASFIYLINLIKGVQTNMSALQDAINALAAQVEQNTTVIGSVEQLVGNLAALIASLKQQLIDAGVDPAIIAQVQAIQTKLETDDSALAALVVANTPAQP
jgi:hypothetical protein